MVICIIAALHHTAFADRYEEYVTTYSDMAVDQMKAYGIPASITLAQGLLESAAGRSTLAREGNNHFGIKCHADWKGDTMLRDDDAPDECFRVYDSPADSFEDHSRFLMRKRYSSLFDLDPSDYAGWARGLSRCGYATDPNYANRLITIIETYGLYAYDNPLDPNAQAVAAFISESLSKTHKVKRARGLHYVIARPGDTYGLIAKELKINKKKLLEYNDAPHDTEIKPWEEVYLEPKLTDAPQGENTATIGEGESLHSLSQRFGMQLDILIKLNPHNPDRPGEKIRLR